MARLAFAAVLLLSAACATPRACEHDLEAPGLKLTMKDGKWLLLVVFAGDGTDSPTELFDEKGGPDKAPPTACARLPRKGFDAKSLPPAKHRPDSYRLMTVGDSAVGAGARGAVYLHQVERAEAYPLMWWGLGEDHGLEELSPKEALARLGVLFPPRKKP